MLLIYFIIKYLKINRDGTITGEFESQSDENFEILSQKKHNDGK